MAWRTCWLSGHPLPYDDDSVAFGRGLRLQRLMAGAVIAFTLLSAAPSRAQSQAEPQVKTEGSAFFSKLRRVQPGKAAPVAPFVTRSGSKLRLPEFRGRVVVLNLWATWCAPCLKELPMLARLQTQLDPEKAVVLAVSQDSGGWRAVDPVWSKLQLSPLEALLDQEARLSTSLRATGLPLTLIYDANRKEVVRLFGYGEWDSTEAVTLIRALYPKSGLNPE
jgi:thiol-disulfide isomerase/thioredoxin